LKLDLFIKFVVVIEFHLYPVGRIVRER